LKRTSVVSGEENRDNPNVGISVKAPKATSKGPDIRNMINNMKQLNAEKD